MSEDESHHHGKNEIIIIKRHGDHDHGHHGGAWKIAYADFMTAMMAFFLVMWLVNAANEATKAAVASYFNPIKLTDAKPAQKGIRKPGKQAEGQATQEKSKVEGEAKSQGSSADTGKQQKSTAGEKTAYSEADYFENPYAVLSEIVLEVGDQANVSIKGEGGASKSGPSTGADGGQAYRDPFDPDFWTHQVEVSSSQQAASAQNDTSSNDKNNQTSNSQKASANSGLTGPLGDYYTENKGNGTGSAQTDMHGKSSREVVAIDGADKGDKKPGQQVANIGKADEGKVKSGKAEKHETAGQQAATKLKTEILDSLKGGAGKLAKGLSVEAVKGGVLISLSDQINTPMFDVGSAVPMKNMVLAMQDIGKVLQSRKGGVVIRGYTDGRPYKAGTGDNWALSLNRARSAYYMLVSGGLGEKRIKQVAGYADRDLKYPKDPYNPANRRIEILVQDGGTAGG